MVACYPTPNPIPEVPRQEEADPVLQEVPGQEEQIPGQSNPIHGGLANSIVVELSLAERADTTSAVDSSTPHEETPLLHLITLTVEFLQRAISDNAEKIKAIELQLSTTGTPKELSTLKTEIQERIARHKKDIETRKRNKFARDAEDYKTPIPHKKTRRGEKRKEKSGQLQDYPIEEERHSLKNLQEDRTIIIKPADKGGALVMMDKNKYVAEITRQLSDDSIYQPLDRDPLPGIRQKIETILHHYTVRGVVDQKTCEFLQNPNPITPVFYTLPKVHKNLENPPGRPIVASTDSVLSPIARYIERILTPLIQRSKSFLLDTGSFLDLIKVTKNIPVDSYLVTLDVKDLYTSIPHGDGIQSPRKLLDSTDRDIDQTSLCIDLLNVILTSNYFLFQDTFFLQKRGTAMGSHAAPPYANAYMIDFEESKIYPSLLFRDNVIIWKRYIDDIF
ncbi:unnamed protein product [Ranitomeya imitator]|uniref:Reverse transcriptase domain-containing protein n=1 Tax=Ranitomeya imitator TaxID=111125 RepID=A0ABN9L4K8_9NEOB|nr:unnamed protein product [Ranitomeya imitator]